MKMLFMLTETWPTESTAKVGKVGVEVLAKAPPPYVKTLGIYIATGGEGMKAYNMYAVEKGHVDEGYKELLKVYTPFFSIEGYKVTVEPLLTPEEALSLIGL